MSTLKADTIQSTGGGAATLTKQAALRMMCFFNQTTTTRHGVASGGVGVSSLNNSSVNDISEGIWAVNLTNAHSGIDLIYLSGAQAANNSCTRREDNSASASRIVCQNNDNDSDSSTDHANYCSTAGDLA